MQSTALKAFIKQLFTKQNKPLSRISYVFCSDQYLLQLNLKHLNHDTYTDIITFPLSELSEPVVSDVYISVDRVKENSIKMQTTFTQELHRVIFHGALHLCGYSDKSKQEKLAMRKKEDEYLNAYFVPRETF